MLITCPECNFTRDVRDDKLPERAQVATCPKCKHKFKFRDLPPEADAQPVNDDRSQERPTQEPPTPEQATQEQPAPEVSGEKTQREEDQPESRPEAESAPTQPEQDAEAENAEQSEDLWGKLESMQPEESPEPDEDEEEDLFSGLGDEPDVEIPVPFEELQEYGFFPGLFQTIKRAMFSPRLFFQVMPLTGLVKPLIFFILISELQVVAELFWQQAGLRPLMPPLPGYAPGDPTVSGGIDFVSIVLQPLILAPILFLGAGINHLFLALTGAANRGYEATFRALAYSSAPFVLSLLPVIGPLGGWAWSTVITVIAFRYVHRTTYTRVIGALLIPLVMTGVLVFYWLQNNPM